MNVASYLHFAMYDWPVWRFSILGRRLTAQFCFQNFTPIALGRKYLRTLQYFCKVCNLSICKASALPLPLLGWWGGCPESSERSICWVSRAIGIISPEKNITFPIRRERCIWCHDCIWCACSLQKQMKIMNRNLTGKLEEMNGMQNVDTHVALSGDFQLLSKLFTKMLRTKSNLRAPLKHLLPRNTWSAAWAHQKVGSSHQKGNGLSEKKMKSPVCDDDRIQT